METKINLADYLTNLQRADTETRKSFLVDFSIDNLPKLDIFKTHKKLYDRLKLVTDTENLYEADQLFKTIHFRCLNNNSIEDALALLFNGIIFFTDKKSLQCAFDLSKAFLETLKKCSKTSLDTILRTQIKLIHESLGKCSPTEEERAEFSIGVLKWSSSLFKKSRMEMADENSIAQNYQNVFGHYDIHRDFAVNYWKEKNYVQARYHFLHSMDSEAFAYMLIECHLNFGYPSEYDLFLAQALFQFLTLRNLKSAEQLFFHYCQKHPMIYQRHNFVEYKEIVKFYKSWLQRDKSYLMYLERIEEYFFDVKPAKKESGGLFSNLMRMLTGDNQNSRAMTSQEAAADSDKEDSHSVVDLEDNDILD
ncbi:Golgi to ER traffic 4 -like protein [Brachionus plicatilis]|uniref:Golgi to ER traffic 4-like protein n=1 Tax=Brachionus plicatilis TaxID=10195 RepID=A0A3M7S801_BRAPC|nr:Golgi to ER traffic 4 -like protein [Brachionus plicatilis]